MKRGPVQPSATPPAWKVAFFKRERALEFAEAEAAAWDAAAVQEETNNAASSTDKEETNNAASSTAKEETKNADEANPPNDMTAQFVMDFIHMDGGMGPSEMVKLRDMLNEELGLTGVWAS